MGPEARRRKNQKKKEKLKLKKASGKAAVSNETQPIDTENNTESTITTLPLLDSEHISNDGESKPIESNILLEGQETNQIRETTEAASQSTSNDVPQYTENPYPQDTGKEIPTGKMIQIDSTMSTTASEQDIEKESNNMELLPSNLTQEKYTPSQDVSIASENIVLDAGSATLDTFVGQNTNNVVVNTESVHKTNAPFDGITIDVKNEEEHPIIAASVSHDNAPATNSFGQTSNLQINEASSNKYNELGGSYGDEVLTHEEYTPNQPQQPSTEKEEIVYAPSTLLNGSLPLSNDNTNRTETFSNQEQQDDLFNYENSNNEQLPWEETPESTEEKQARHIKHDDTKEETEDSQQLEQEKDALMSWEEPTRQSQLTEEFSSIKQDIHDEYVSDPIAQNSSLHAEEQNSSQPISQSEEFLLPEEARTIGGDVEENTGTQSNPQEHLQINQQNEVADLFGDDDANSESLPWNASAHPKIEEQIEIKKNEESDSNLFTTEKNGEETLPWDTLPQAETSDEVDQSVVHQASPKKFSFLEDDDDLLEDDDDSFLESEDEDIPEKTEPAEPPAGKETTASSLTTVNSCLLYTSRCV